MILEGHSVTRVAPRKSRNGKDMWDVGLSDGNDWTTFDGGLASLAANIVGQPGYRFDVSLNGKYKNFDGIIQPGQALPEQAVAPGTTVPAGTPVTAGPTQVVGNANSAEQERMAFFGAMKNAVALVGKLYEGAGPEGYEQAMENVKDATLRFLSAAKAAEQGKLISDPVQQHDGTAAGVAEAVNQAAGEAVVQQGVPTTAAAGPSW